MKPSATVQTRRPTAPRIRPATAHDLDALDGIYAHARRFMAQTGNPTQWGSNEPSREELAASINAGTLFVGTNEDNAPCSAFVLIATPEPTYQHIYDGSWPSDEPYLTLHRVASDGTADGTRLIHSELTTSLLILTGPTTMWQPHSRWHSYPSPMTQSCVWAQHRGMTSR
ncbi:hypothetical protein [uncultured Parolsenella sp.]|uniref:hypothetical protein n=1 Tax=uncultured Parolsenella sp. TaxID=2083008 RepID=UPI0027D9B532|nr:hypothetical protein [uncultured Parolsenella sp.]